MYKYICELVQETRNHGKVYLGASPRSSLAILKAAKATAAIQGRAFVIPDDIQYVAPHIINHRLILLRSSSTSHSISTELLLPTYLCGRLVHSILVLITIGSRLHLAVLV